MCFPCAPSPCHSAQLRLWRPSPGIDSIGKMVDHRNVSKTCERVQAIRMEAIAIRLEAIAVRSVQTSELNSLNRHKLQFSPASILLNAAIQRPNLLIGRSVRFCF